MNAAVVWRSYDTRGGEMVMVARGEVLVDPPRSVTVESEDGRHIVPWHQLVEVHEERADEE